jgi:hypothetical protein
VAAANPTALDTVLARLILAERPADPAMLAELAALAPLPGEAQLDDLRGNLTLVVP